MQGLKGALSELKNVVKEKKDKVSQDMLESRKSVKVGSLPMTKKVGGAKKKPLVPLGGLSSDTDEPGESPKPVTAMQAVPEGPPDAAELANYGQMSMDTKIMLGQQKGSWKPTPEEIQAAGFRGGFVTLEIAEAKELIALDTNILKKGGGASDPYMKVLVNGQKQVHKTATKSSTLEPIWNEKIDFYVSPDETMLTLQLFDYDRIGDDDSMGRITIDLEKYTEEASWKPKWIAVQPDDDCPNATGKVLLTLSVKQNEFYKHEGGKGTLHIVNADGLIATDSSFTGKGTSDPYIKVLVDGWRQIHQTTVKDNTLSPTWNEKVEFDLQPGEITLVFEFFDKDVDADDPMGRAVFNVVDTEIKSSKLKNYKTEEELEIKPQQACLKAQGKLRIVMNYEPWKPPKKEKKQKQSLHGVGDLPKNPTPFCLRSLSTEEDHRLWNVTFIGRSEKKLRDGVDLRLDSKDVSGIHAAIEIYGDKLREWIVRVSDEGSSSGTDVDGIPCVPGKPVVIGTGAAIRFGRGEIWILERKALKPRSRLPKAQDHLFAENEYSLTISDAETLNTLLRCPEWIDFTEVILEKINLLNEAPCADYIEVKDESGTVLSAHQVTTPEEMEEYNMVDVLRHVDLGGSVLVRLTSDPYLLAPMVERNRMKKEELQKRIEEREDLE